MPQPDTRALYAGSFDPPTHGHEAIIREAARVFDEVEVAIGVNAVKRYTFTVPEREEMLRVVSADLGNVSVANYTDRLLIAYATDGDFTHIVRGLRTADDFNAERTLQVFNHDHNPDITTVYIPCPRELDIVSSSMVKGLVGNEGWEEYARKYVHSFVLDGLRRVHANREQ